jgi:glutamine synthetase
MTELSEKQKQILEDVNRNKVKFISLQFTDLFGNVKNVTIPAEELRDSFVYGTWFDGSSIEGFARICESDMLLKPDPNTYTIIPWFENNTGRTARLICDVYTTTEKPFESDPRFILKGVIEEAKKRGFIYYTGPEVEFFLLRSENGLKRLPHDTGSYFDLALDKAYEIRSEMIGILQKLGISTEASHHEVASGQHEIDLKYSDALTIADQVITLKFTLKAIAEKYDCHVTFMPKPFFGINGSGMHVHQSLGNNEGKNLFFNEKDRYILSELAYNFIAGQLVHAKAMAGIVAPTINSYKRLVPGYEAPVYICWGSVNRSALIRIPRVSVGKWHAVRAELRCPDPSCNPYLAFAVMLKAGLDGINKEIKPPEPVEEDIYKFNDDKLSKLGIETLPGSLIDAVKEMKRDSIIREVLGDNTFQKYVNAKLKEWKDFITHVTNWEIENYLELL